MTRKEDYESTNLSLDEDDVTMYFLKGFLNFTSSKKDVGKIWQV
jgi:hypothetical protein